MKNWVIACFLFLSLILTSCIEIIDDLKLNIDGSGTFRYTLNLSSSKVKINSILALDSLDGERVPTKDELNEKIIDFKNKLALKEGLKNVVIEEDFTNYIFKLSCDFENVELLQEAIKKSINEIAQHASTSLDNHQWVIWENNSLERTIPQIAVDQIKRLKTDEIELLKDGTYTIITRFDKEIKRFENESAVLSKSKKAVMLRINTYDLLNNADLFKNKIYLIE